MIYKSELQEQIYKLERKISLLEDALMQAGVFGYDNRPTYSNGYYKLIINEVKTK